MSFYFQTPHCQSQNSENMKTYYKAMSKVRIALEWFFCNVKNCFKFILRFTKKKKFCLSPLGKIKSVCASLQNEHACLCGDEAANYFGTQPPKLREYFL